MPSNRIKGLIRRRDDGICWHCGCEETTIHHRKNRGMGGSKPEISDRPSNLLTICPEYNGLMESDVNAYREATENGWKLRNGMHSLEVPVWRYDHTWWILNDLGDKFQLEQEGLF